MTIPLLSLVMAHIEKTNANSRKVPNYSTDKEVEIVAKAYEKELLEEINEKSRKWQKTI